MSIEKDFAESLEAIYDAIGEDATLFIDDIPTKVKVIKVVDYGADYEDYEAYRAIASKVRGVRPGDEMEIQDDRAGVGTRTVTVKNVQLVDDGLEVRIGV